MISSLNGKVEALGSDWAIINVGGIGFQVFMPTSTLSAIGQAGKEVKLYTHLHLREDNVVLYGFATPQELSLFQTLISVSGLGPRMALSMLSAMRIEHLVTAIASGSAEMLTTVPGIGKKMASRIVLELREKISAGWITSPAPGFARENADVLSALTALGYSAAEATKAVASLPASDLPLEEKVKLALQYFGGK
jgi:Holliday junction DNA helicase RuvA